MPRLLVILPSWLGDAVMATPALRLLRARLPGSFIGALVRPGIDELLAGLDLLDEMHVEHATGVLGPKFVAAKLRPRRYDAAILFSNSFSTALIARIAGIPRRLGYGRDARGLLLTERLDPPRRPDGSWAPVPAVAYYHRLAASFLAPPGHDLETLPIGVRLELAATPDDEAGAAAILDHAGVPIESPLAILNPGGNNAAKRWSPDRFAAIADHLALQHGLTVLINGSPAEAPLAARVASLARERPVELPRHGVTIGSLKALVRRSRIMVTNDTGPRHIAAAFGVPVVTLFGPTDPRWTTIPAPGGEAVLVADPTLPASEVADDHPDRCRIDRISVDSVRDAVDALLAGPRAPSTPGTPAPHATGRAP